MKAEESYRLGITQRSGARGMHRDRKPVCGGSIFGKPPVLAFVMHSRLHLGSLSRTARLPPGTPAVGGEGPIPLGHRPIPRGLAHD